jgi:hypothetical protein
LTVEEMISNPSYKGRVAEMVQDELTKEGGLPSMVTATERALILDVVWAACRDNADPFTIDRLIFNFHSRIVKRRQHYLQALHQIHLDTHHQ